MDMDSKIIDKNSFTSCRLNIWLRIFSVLFISNRHLYFLCLDCLSYRFKEVKSRCCLYIGDVCLRWTSEYTSTGTCKTLNAAKKLKFCFWKRHLFSIFLMDNQVSCMHWVYRYKLSFIEFRCEDVFTNFWSMTDLI